MDIEYCTRCGSSMATPESSCPCILNDAAGRIARTPCHVGGFSNDLEEDFVLRFEREANAILYQADSRHVAIDPLANNLARAIYRALKAEEV